MLKLKEGEDGSWYKLLSTEVGLGLGLRVSPTNKCNEITISEGAVQEH